MNTRPIVGVIGPRWQLFVGLSTPGTLWHDNTLLGHRVHWLNLSTSRSPLTHAITLIIGPLYLRIGRRAS